MNLPNSQWMNVVIVSVVYIGDGPLYMFPTDPCDHPHNEFYALRTIRNTDECIVTMLCSFPMERLHKVNIIIAEKMSLI